jgi:hypothetical protein
MARWIQSCLDANGGHFQHVLCHYISHTTNVILFKFRCNIFIGLRWVIPVLFIQYELYNVLCRQNTTAFKKWYMEYYTINYMFRPLYINHPKVFLKLIDLLYKQYGVLWEGGWTKSHLQYWVSWIRIFGWNFLISAAVIWRDAPWSTLCVLIKPGRLLCVSVIVMGCP